MTFPVNIPLQFFFFFFHQQFPFTIFPEFSRFPVKRAYTLKQSVYIIKLMNMSENIIRENIYEKSFHNE